MLAILCALMGIAIGGVSRTFAKPTYDAKSSAIVTAKPSIQASDSTSFAANSQGVMSSLSGLTMTQTVLQPVALSAGKGMTWESLQFNVRTDVPIGSTLISFYVNDTDPKRAADIADGLPVALGQAVDQLGGSGFGVGGVRVTIVQQAVLPKSPSSLTAQGGGIIGGIVGLLCGVVAVSLLGRRVRDSGEGR